jgi:hypothetical protein
MAEIQLEGGHTALIDDADALRCGRYRWKVLEGPNTVYVVSSNGKLLHRLLLNAPKGMDVDHIDRNGLNNHRNNLRLATRYQNIANSAKRRSPSTSRYRGVFWNKLCGKWSAQITTDGQSVHLGVYDSEEDAARAYNVALLGKAGEFALPNALPTPLPANGNLPLILEAAGVSGLDAQVVALLVSEGLSHAETGKRLGLTIGDVTEIVDRLRDKFAAHWDELAEAEEDARKYSSAGHLLVLR